jgi:Uma2 family endonuclease
MTVDLKHLTFQQYLGLPEMKACSSIIDGELVMVVAPTTEHQRCILELALKLTPVARERRLGEVFIAPIDIVIQRDPLRTRQPDLLFISNARRYIIGRQVIEGGPDPAIDILSPTNACRKLEEKLRDYQSINVREAWIVVTQGQTVEVLQLSPEGIDRSGLYGLGDLIVSQELPELCLMVDEIFPELEQSNATAVGEI